MSVLMNNQMYTFYGRIHQQVSGGSIGLELTRNYLGVYDLVGLYPQITFSRIWDIGEADETVC